jgi:RNA-directed DNA polymerase
MWTLRIWDELASPLHLWRAWGDFSRGKRRRSDVATFSLDADRHVHRLARELQVGAYRPGPYDLLFIHDPKRRIVAAAPVRDRVVHHAIHRLVAPRFEAALIEHTYACLPGRGSHRAVLRYLACARRFRYVLPLDVRRYYYSIDRTLLRGLLFRRLPEPATRTLLDRILASGAGLYRRRDVADWLGWDGPAPDGVGLPIGNLTSQWWGNFYLGGLDHFACRTLRVPSYQRYMDDFTVFGDDRGELLRIRDRLAEWLRVERRIVLKDPGARPLRTDGRLHYLGYTVSRAGVALGPKARERMRGNLAGAAADSERLRATVASYAAAWLFGS